MKNMYLVDLPLLSLRGRMGLSPMPVRAEASPSMRMSTMMVWILIIVALKIIINLFSFSILNIISCYLSRPVLS